MIAHASTQNARIPSRSPARAWSAIGASGRATPAVEECSGPSATNGASASTGGAPMPQRGARCARGRCWGGDRHPLGRSGALVDRRLLLQHRDHVDRGAPRRRRAGRRVAGRLGAGLRHARRGHRRPLRSPAQHDRRRRGARRRRRVLAHFCGVWRARPPSPGAGRRRPRRARRGVRPRAPRQPPRDRRRRRGASGDQRADGTRRGGSRAPSGRLAGVVAAHVSVPSFFTIDALSFVASAGALLSIAGRHGWAPTPSVRAGRPRGLAGVLADMRDALRLVWQNRPVSWAFGALFIVNATWCAGFYVGSVFPRVARPRRRRRDVRLHHRRVRRRQHRRQPRHHQPLHSPRLSR